MVLAFNKWSVDGIVVEDPGLVNYISLEPRVVPKSGARYAGRRFHKAKVFIVERLINKLMVNTHKSKEHYIQKSGSQTGKAITNYNIVKKAFEIVENKTNENPVHIFVKALEHAAPREGVVTIEYGGARYPKAVDMAPLRRIDIALRYMTQGAIQKSFQKKKSIEQALADEIMNAYNFSNTSAAIAKKIELERQADSSR